MNSNEVIALAIMSTVAFILMAVLVKTIFEYRRNHEEINSIIDDESECNQSVGSLPDGFIAQIKG